MLSGNNIHVQQHKTNMINEEWNKTQNDAPFVAFYDMRAVTLFCQMKWQMCRSRDCSDLQIELVHSELFALEFGKIAEDDFVYTQSTTNTDQSAPNLVKMYVIIRSQMSSIMDLIGPELSELFALELKNLPYLTLFTL